jgi:S1-C subfamily serine protease
LNISTAPQVSTSQKTLSTSEARPTFDDLKSSVLVLRSNGRKLAIAGLIDPSGLYVASRYAVANQALDAVDGFGAPVPIRIKSFDERSDLVLLERTGPKPDNSSGNTLETASEVKIGDVLHAILPDGVFRVEVTSDELVGLVGHQKQMIPVIRIALENPERSYAPALFLKGRVLVGCLTSVSADTVQAEIQHQGALGGGPGRNSISQAQFGPGGLAVAYMIGPSLTQRALLGFRSPSASVIHPWLGAICRDSLKGGAEVVVVQPESPAAKAGLRIGDTIVRIGNYVIRNQIDYGRAMFHQTPNSAVQMDVARANGTIRMIVTIGGQSDR